MNLGPPRYCAIVAIANVVDSSPSYCSSGYQEILFTYLRKGKYPEDFEKKDKQALRKRVKFFCCERCSHILKFILGLYLDTFTEQHHIIVL